MTETPSSVELTPEQQAEADRQEALMAPYTPEQRAALEGWGLAMEQVAVHVEELQRLGISQMQAMGLLAAMAGEELPPLAAMLLG